MCVLFFLVTLGFAQWVMSPLSLRVLLGFMGAELS